MRFIVSFVLLLGLSLGQPVAAQPLNFAGDPPTEADRQRLEGCIELADRTNGDLSPCIGIAVTSCDEGLSGSTHDIVSCYRRELGFWDELLNRSYQQLRTSLDDDQRNDLRDIQRGWIAFRDDSCSFQYNLTDGSMGQIFYAACQNRQTASRAISLRNMVAYFEGF